MNKNNKKNFIIIFLFLFSTLVFSQTRIGGTSRVGGSTNVAILSPHQIFADFINGDDTNLGTFASPVKTVRKAADLVQGHCGWQAVLRGVVFPLSSILTFTSADNGCPGNPILYINYPGETPVISGGVRLTGWTNTGGSPPAWTHTGVGLNDTEMLFYDGDIRYRPRLAPGTSGINTDIGTQFRVAQVFNNCGSGSDPCYDRFGYDPADTSMGATWTNLNNSGAPCSGSAGSYPVGNIEVIYIPKFNGSRLRVKCRDTTAHIIYFTGQTPNTDDARFAVGHRYTVENVLDSGGHTKQWFWDKASNVITYWADAGEDPNTHEVYIPQLATPIIATGLADVVYQGITFKLDNFLPVASGYAGQQSDFFAPQLFRCTNCKRVVWNKDTFTNTMGHALRFDSDATGTCTNNSVTNSVFYILGAGGIYAGRFPPTLGDTDANICQGTNISNTDLRSGGRFLIFGAAVLSGLEQNTLVTHNQAQDFFSYALANCIPTVSPCGTTTTSGPINTVFSFNKVFNIGQGLTYDFGGIYFAGYTATGNVITNNIVHDIIDASVQDSSFFASPSGGQGIYVDNVTQDVLTKNNLVYNISESCLRSSKGPQTAGHPNIYDNNICAFTREGVFLQGKPPTSAYKQAVITHTIVYKDRSYTDTPTFLMAVQCGPFGTLSNIQQWDFNNYFDPNVDISNPSYTELWAINDSSCNRTGSFYDKAAWVAAGEDPHSIWNTNPGFADAANRNFTLSGSPGAGFVVFDITLPGLSNSSLLPPIPGSILPAWPTNTTITF